MSGIDSEYAVKILWGTISAKNLGDGHLRANSYLCSLLYYKFWIKKSGSRPKLGRWKIKSEAEKLYEQMYTAFAE